MQVSDSWTSSPSGTSNALGSFPITSVYFWSHGMQDLNSPTRDRTVLLAVEAQCPNFWTTKKFPNFLLLSHLYHVPHCPIKTFGPTYLLIFTRKHINIIVGYHHSHFHFSHLFSTQVGFCPHDPNWHCPVSIADFHIGKTNRYFSSLTTLYLLGTFDEVIYLFLLLLFIMPLFHEFLILIFFPCSQAFWLAILWIGF